MDEHDDNSEEECLVVRWDVVWVSDRSCREDHGRQSIID